MDFHDLSTVFGPWAAVAMVIAYVFYRDLKGQIRYRDEQIEDRDKRIEALERAADEAVRAKNEEIREWRTRAMGDGRR